MNYLLENFLGFLGPQTFSEHNSEVLHDTKQAQMGEPTTTVASTFELPGWRDRVIVTLPEGLTKERLLGFKPFIDWKSRLQNSIDQQRHSYHPFFANPFHLEAIDVKSFSTKDRYGTGTNGPLLFVKLFAHIVNEKRDTLPGVVFLRGGSVTILMILHPRDRPQERYVIMTEQARSAAGSFCFQELPAGMLDDNDNFIGKAADEIKQEVNLEINAEDLVDLTKKVLELGQKKTEVEESLEWAMYPSPGACDEFITIYLWEQAMDRADIEDMHGRLAGVRAEEEYIRVRLWKYEELLQVGARDAKTLAAWSLYEHLKREKKI